MLFFANGEILCAPDSPKNTVHTRLAGRVARKASAIRGGGVENLAQVPRRTKSLANFRPKDPKVNPLDREPSDAIHLVQVDAQRRSSSLDALPARAGQRSDPFTPALFI